MRLRSTVLLFILLSMPLTACLFAGPSFDAEQGGQLWCNEPITENESIVIKGNSCIVDQLSVKASPIKVLSAEEIRSISFPSFSQHNKIIEGYTFSPEDTDLPILEFLKESKTVDAIKEHGIRYIVFISDRSYEEPMPEPYSAEDWQGAFLGIYREEKSTYSALVVDAQKTLVSGSLLQESKGTNIIFPLLATFSDPDPAKSACEAIASSIAKILKGDCEGFSP